MVNRTIIKSVGALSVGKIIAVIYGVLGLLIGFFVSLIALTGAALGGEGGAGALIMGVGAVIIMPILYAVLGFIVGVITGAVYNIAAGLIGGLEVELEQ